MIKVLKTLSCLISDYPESYFTSHGGLVIVDGNDKLYIFRENLHLLGTSVNYFKFNSCQPDYRFFESYECNCFLQSKLDIAVEALDTVNDHADSCHIFIFDETNCTCFYEKAVQALKELKNE